VRKVERFLSESEMEPARRVIPAMPAKAAAPSIDKVWGRVRKAAGLADVRLHDCGTASPASAPPAG
jgi:hypothetical protein